MPVHQTSLNLRTSKKLDVIPVTDLVNRAIEDLNVHEGLCVLFVPHTTSAIIANEHFDPNVPQDIFKALARLAPDNESWGHPEDNAPAHIKASLSSSSLSVPIQDGKLAVGQWQGLFFLDYDGPRDRKLLITVVV